MPMSGSQGSYVHPENGMTLIDTATRGYVVYVGAFENTAKELAVRNAIFGRAERGEAWKRL